MPMVQIDIRLTVGTPFLLAAPIVAHPFLGSHGAPSVTEAASALLTGCGRRRSGGGRWSIAAVVGIVVVGERVSLVIERDRRRRDTTKHGIVGCETEVIHHYAIGGHQIAVAVVGTVTSTLVSQVSQVANKRKRHVAGIEIVLVDLEGGKRARTIVVPLAVQHIDTVTGVSVVEQQLSIVLRRYAHSKDHHHDQCDDSANSCSHIL